MNGVFGFCAGLGDVGQTVSATIYGRDDDNHVTGLRSFVVHVGPPATASLTVILDTPGEEINFDPLPSSLLIVPSPTAYNNTVEFRIRGQREVAEGISCIPLILSNSWEHPIGTVQAAASPPGARPLPPCPSTRCQIRSRSFIGHRQFLISGNTDYASPLAMITAGLQARLSMSMFVHLRWACQTDQPEYRKLGNRHPGMERFLAGDTYATDRADHIGSKCLDQLSGAAARRGRNLCRKYRDSALARNGRAVRAELDSGARGRGATNL